ncbi:MAG: sugar-binding protein, partial [Candidatus Sericytochromatia bacterium]
PGGRGAHFSAEGLGKLIHRPSSGRYTLEGLLGADGTETPLRAAPPILAVRAPKGVSVDARFGEWEAVETEGITGLRFEDVALLKYKRRDRHGMDDCSADVRLMWDERALYVRASVFDDVVAPGPAGRDLYQGDHLAVWLDWDLQGDFRQDARSADDWQIGLKPASAAMPAGAHVWVPKSGPQGVQVASRPLVDTYSGGVYGYELEAAIPWAAMGGLPPGVSPTEPKPSSGAKPGAARRYTLGVAGAVGFGLVLTDSDKRAQELVYVSNPGFTWSAPRSFNTLLLVEPRQAATSSH